MKTVDFGSRLKELRLNAGLTQKQLADQIGITKSVVSFYELRERTPSPDILVKLSSVFHVSTDYLLGIEKNKTIDISGLDSEDEKVIMMMIQQLRKKTAITNKPIKKQLYQIHSRYNCFLNHRTKCTVLLQFSPLTTVQNVRYFSIHTNKYTRYISILISFADFQSIL